MHPSNGGSSGGAVRESATFSSGRVGGGGGSLAAHGLDAPLRQLIEAKEKELHEIHDFRIRYDKLKEDFKFNLGLIEDRDLELGRYEAALQSMKDCLRDKEVEASEVKMRLDEALSVHRQAATRENEQEGYWQAKCKGLRDERDGLRWAREEESRAARERSEAVKAALTRQLREREDDLEAQRADAAEAFDRIMQQRQEEAQNRESELTLQLREQEARCTDHAKKRDRAERDAVEAKDREEGSGVDWVGCGGGVGRWEGWGGAVAARREEASRTLQVLKERHEAEIRVGEDKLREVLGSLHAVEKAFVQHRDRQSSEEHEFERREEELHAKLDACNLRIQSLEEAVAKGEQREEELRRVVRAARDDHAKEVSAVRKTLSEEEAFFKRETGQAKSTTAALRDTNLSLEGTVASLTEKNKVLALDLAEEKEKRGKLEQSLRSAKEELEQLHQQLTTARHEEEAAMDDLARARRQLEDRDEAAGTDRRELQATIDRLEKRLAREAAADTARGPQAFLEAEGTPEAAWEMEVSGWEIMELRAANLRLRGVVGDMRREMEAFRGDPRASSFGGGEGEREHRLENENEDLREQLSELRGQLERAEGQAAVVVELEDELSRLQARCGNLAEEAGRLSGERDKLMEIGNNLRAELNRAVSTSFQRDGDTGTKSAAAAAAAAAAAEEAKVAEAERIQAAVSHVQRETRRKYRARVCEVEAAFSQLAADNRRLKARVGQLSGTRVGTGSGWVGEGGEGASGGELGGGGGRAGRIGGKGGAGGGAGGGDNLTTGRGTGWRAEGAGGLRRGKEPPEGGFNRVNGRANGRSLSSPTRGGDGAAAAAAAAAQQQQQQRSSARNRPPSGAERQTEGQRAAAQRLRAWQERRRRSESGEEGAEGTEKGRRREVRGVRNYNVRED
eukprot:jgi/Undpi1/3120/HiC_scaffold_15.g06494.m1